MTENDSRQNEVEILCIGTELLLGNILNSNARWLAEELAALGLPHYRQTVIGDNPKRLKESILEASERSNYLITTGGLGATQDDITTEVIAESFNSKLKKRENVFNKIEAKVITQSRSTKKESLKQSLFPERAKIIPNDFGTAPGMIWTPKEGFTILTFPGVPSELKAMWSSYAVPWLMEKTSQRNIFISKVMRFTGIGESQLAEEADDLFTNTNPTLAPYADIGEVRLRLTAKEQSKERAEEIIKPIEKKILKRFGNYFYGTDNESLASVVIKMLIAKNEKLFVAESCTGGGIGATLSAIPGASNAFLGGIIAYNNHIKHKFLGVPYQLLEDYGAVSSQVVQAMAEGARKNSGADWSIATSGIAGPDGGSTSKPVGLIHFAIAGPHGCSLSSESFGSYKGRIAIQKLSVVGSLNKLRLLLLTRS